jgi:hypothetical protein
VIRKQDEMEVLYVTKGRDLNRELEEGMSLLF